VIREALLFEEEMNVRCEMDIMNRYPERKLLTLF